MTQKSIPSSDIRIRQPLRWQIATLTGIRQETPRVKTLTLSLPEWIPHRPGQHYDVRLTAPDGYQAQRSYSIASEPERSGEIDLTIELLEDGEVSSYLHQEIRQGDQVEVRGPIGGYFVWEAAMRGPLLLIAGGSGVVPLMAMIRHRAAARSRVPTRLLFSSRSSEEIIYAGELEALQAAHDGLEVIHTLTRSQPPGWRGYARRIDRPMLAEVIAPLGDTPWTYVCGPTLLVESAANHLVGLGLPADRIRTERFGPTGSNG
jgi:ferredoxin-NADP reductase